MAQKFVSAGSGEEVILYQDDDTYSDGETHEAVRTDGQMRVDAAVPTQDYHLTRKDYVDSAAAVLAFWEEDGDGDLMPKA